MTKPRTDTEKTDHFTCPSCGREYGDPLYHGPWPHAPATVCFDCWVDEWAVICFQYSIGRDPSGLDQALWLISRGCTQSKAAELIHVHRNTIGNWLRRLRSRPWSIPDWLVTPPSESSRKNGCTKRCRSGKPMNRQAPHAHKHKNLRRTTHGKHPSRSKTRL